MNIRRLLSVFLPAPMLALLAPSAAFAQQKPPNVLFIMGDDIGWMQVGLYPPLQAAATYNLDAILKAVQASNHPSD